MNKKKMPPGKSDDGSVLARIAELRDMNGEQLRERWFALIPDKPLPRTHTAMLCRLIHRVQEIAHGGLSAATLARLEAIADADEGATENRMEKTVVGTIFRTEWHGEQHEVLSIPEGFEYRGAKYRSLTAIAKHITGQHLNGRRFFGVTARNRKGTRK